MDRWFGVGALRCVRMREAAVLRAEMEMSAAQVGSMFAAVLGRQEPPNRRALAGFEGESASDRSSAHQNIFGINPTAKTKFCGQMTKSRNLRTRDAAALVQPNGSGDTRCCHALSHA